MLARVAEKSETVQWATFLHVAGEEAIKVCTFEFSEKERNKIQVLKDRFKNYCEPRKNLPYIRHVFFTRSQGPAETIDMYVTDLKSKAKDCEFGDVHDSLIRDRIVCGIREDQLKGRLLRETDLTLEKAIDICRASEITSSQMKALNDEVNVHKVESIKPKKRDTKSEHTSVMRKECSRCGNKHEYRKCPAYGKTCKSCQKKNHFAKMCNTKDLQAE